MENKDAQTISNGIVDFNQSSIPDLENVEDEIKFFVLSKNQHGNVIGGLRAVCYWNTLHIELLWLDSSCRGTGVGSKLLEKAEKYAIKHGYELALVETTSWQAKPFYIKNGYSLEYSIKDRPKGHESHYLSKNLLN